MNSKLEFKEVIHCFFLFYQFFIKAIWTVFFKFSRLTVMNWKISTNTPANWKNKSFTFHQKKQNGKKSGIHKSLSCQHFCDVWVYRWFKFLFLNEILIKDHSTPLGIKSRRSVHSQTLVGTADVGMPTWFPIGRCDVGILPTLGSRPSISLWQTRIWVGFYLW